MTDRQRREIQKAMFHHRDEAFGESVTDPPPIPDWFYWDVDARLILPPYNSRTCANVRGRTRLWARTEDKALEEIVCLSAPLLNQIAQLCVRSSIHECTNAACVKTRKAMDQVAPLCQWECFREWAIAMMSCQASMTHEQRLTRAHTHLATAANLCHYILMKNKRDNELDDDDLFGKDSRRQKIDLVAVCEIIYWMLTIQAHIGVGDVFEGKWGPEFLPRKIIRPASNEAFKTAKKMGICKNRLWSLINVTERKEADLPGFMETVEYVPGLDHKPHIRPDGKALDHKSCSKKKCELSNFDFSYVPQDHKGGPHCDCDESVFREAVLNSAFRKFKHSVWSIDGKCIIDPKERYIAISHVWSDGTGEGDMKKGVVNSCLSNYFISIAKRLNCNGIWWDTISLVTLKDLRKQALSMMQSNYHNAAYTVIHDKYLLDFEWDEDGSPCVALVLSPWFSRVWTAVELSMSKRIKVLYKGRDRKTPLIKDLDDDILARDPGRATRAHWIATLVIKRLREKVSTVNDVLAILEHRAVSKKEDRMRCAGLFAQLPEKHLQELMKLEDTRDEAADITSEILKKLGEIGHDSLYHRKHPMSKSGPFSWAPKNLFDIPYTSLGDLGGNEIADNILTVHEDGTIEGDWYYRVLTQDDCDRNLKPLYEDDYKVDAIDAGKRSWRNCILLREHQENQGKALLVATVGKERDSNDFADIIDCRYIGPVMERPGGIKPGIRFECIRLGNEKGRRDTDARRLLRLSEP
jgi:hypothetical protein